MAGPRQAGVARQLPKKEHNAKERQEAIAIAGNMEDEPGYKQKIKSISLAS